LTNGAENSGITARQARFGLCGEAGGIKMVFCVLVVA